MNRRKFLNKTSLLLGTLGFSHAFKVDLLEKVHRTLIPQASADENEPRRVLELCFRYGIPMIMFGTGREFKQLKAPRYSNFSYAGNDVLQVSAASSLLLNVDSASLMPHADNIAITQGVQTTGGHTGMFNYREGGGGQGKASQIIELANLNTTASLVQGIQWPGDAQNSLAGKQNLTRVTSTSLKDLFKQKTLKFKKDEMNLILEAANKVSRRQALLLDDKLKQSLTQFQAYDKAQSMFASDYAQLLSLSGMNPNLTPSGFRPAVSEALGMTLKSMQHNLVNSSLVTIELGDIHGFQTDKQMSGVIKPVSDMIAATVSYLKATPDLAAGAGKTLWDTTLIVAGSEFNRGISPFNRDNSDGGTQGIMLIGKNVKGGYYGGFGLDDVPNSTTEGRAFGFDRLTGQTTMGVKNSVAEVYQTVRAAAGLKLTTTEKEKVLYAMLK